MAEPLLNVSMQMVFLPKEEEIPNKSRQSGKKVEIK